MASMSDTGGTGGTGGTSGMSGMSGMSSKNSARNASSVRRISRRFAAWATVLACTTPLCAQALQMERRAYARVQELRNELLGACLDLDETGRRAVAEMLVEDDLGSPFDLLGRALARARHVDADADALFRAGLMAMVLPEVVNQGDGPTDYDRVHVTLHAPRKMATEDLGEVTARISAVDPAGEVVAHGSIVRNTDIEDLLRFASTTAVSLRDRPDGRYRVHVEVLLGGRPPRSTDCRLDAPVDVLRGYKQRALALPIAVDMTEQRVAEIREMTAGIDALREDERARAILNGALWQVERAFRGEPRVPGSDPVVDLRRAERIFDNLRAGRLALAGLTGRVTIGLPVESGGAKDAGDVGAAKGAAEIAIVSVALPERSDAGEPQRKPLLLFVPGAPTWNDEAQRPTSPESVMPGWLEDQLRRAGFDRDGRFYVAVMESPGRFWSAPHAVADVARALADILPVLPDRTVWIGEREGAYAVGRAAVLHPELVRGLVLVCGGPLSAADLEAMPDVRILAVTGTRHPSLLSLRQLAKVAHERAAATGAPPQVELLDSDARPWPIAVGLAARDIAAFAAGL